MNTIPTPKYKIDDVVFHISTHSVVKNHNCPDCLGTRKWAVITPAGSNLTCKCMRCDGNISNTPPLRYTVYEPYIKSLTIGSIRIDTADYSGRIVSYMCKETGVGSGSIYDEANLYATEEEAKVAAEIEAERRTKTEEVVPEAIERMEFSQLTLESAALKNSYDAMWRSWYHLNQLRDELQSFIEENPAAFKGWDEEYSSKQILKHDNYHVENHPMKLVIDLLKEGKTTEALDIIPQLSP